MKIREDKEIECTWGHLYSDQIYTTNLLYKDITKSLSLTLHESMLWLYIWENAFVYTCCDWKFHSIKLFVCFLTYAFASQFIPHTLKCKEKLFFTFHSIALKRHIIVRTAAYAYNLMYLFLHNFYQVDFKTYIAKFILYLNVFRVKYSSCKILFYLLILT